MSQQPYYPTTTGGGAAPVIVQGTAVPAHSHYAGTTNPPATIPVSTYHHDTLSQPVDVEQQGGGEWSKGEAQPKRCNDVFFALLFYAHLGVMAWATAKYAPQMADSMADQYAGYGGGRMLDSEMEEEELHVNMFASAMSVISGGGTGRRLEEEAQQDDGGYSNVDFNDIMFILGICGLVGFVVSTLALSFMIHFAAGLIKFALFFNMFVSGLVAVAGFLSGAMPLAIIGLVGFAFTAYYAYVVWARIPFAASNLITAVTAVRANFGLSFFAYSSLLFLFGWSVWWATAFVSSMYAFGGCNAAGECQNDVNGFIVFLYLVSYFWTHQVIKNTVHVTVAGTVGTWWFSPIEASSCCSRGVRDSFFRAITYSFGSICLGSLIVAIIQAIKEIVRQLRESDDGVLLCLAQCILGCIESLVEYFNQWAFVFVGLYGYTFLEAGRNVMTLFRTRGWTTIITDNLVDSVLFMVSIGVGVITGLISSLICTARGLVFEEGSANFIPFIIGLVIGFGLTSTLMSVVGSGVNTVIVCYAEAPNEFQANHPELSNEMRAAWRQAWPVDFKY